MNIELTVREQNLLKKILDSYLSDLMLEIAATQRGTSPLHEKEEILKSILKKLKSNFIVSNNQF